jgi:hypothetical protein
MNTAELLSILCQEGFRESSYSLAGEHPDEALCLREEQGRWCVYYAERGLKTGKQFFESEEAACEHFLTEMIADPTTRASWKSGFSMLKESTHE